MTEQYDPQGSGGDQSQDGPNRRALFAAAAGAATTSSMLATSAMAQERASAILATATPTDYTRDPTRWGRPDVAALFPGFQHIDMRTGGAVIRLRHGGS